MTPGIEEIAETPGSGVVVHGDLVENGASPGGEIAGRLLHVVDGEAQVMASVQNLFDDRTIVAYQWGGGEGVTPDELITNRPRTVALTLTDKF